MSLMSLPTRDALTLGGFALAAGLLLALVNSVTKAPIEQIEQQRLESTLKEVLPARYFNNNLQSNKRTFQDNHNQKPREVYRAYLNNQPSAAVIKTHTHDGYSGRIDILIGVTTDALVTGVRVLQHSETPGLGDDIELRKSDWILSFNDKHLKGEFTWKVKRDGGDFDQFTGATITPRAIVRETRKTLEWYTKHRQQVFETP